MRNRGFSMVNIIGLAIGMACFLLIVLYVQDELSYDDFHSKGDQIYRVALERKYPGRSRDYAFIPRSYAEAIQKEFPGVEKTCRLFNFGPANIIFKKGDATTRENDITWADSTFFEFFDIPLLAGDPKTALREPHSIILTESMARKYFGENWDRQSILGKVMDIVQNDNDPKITGVCADVPDNSHLKFDFLQSATSIGFLQGPPDYISFSAITYLMLDKNTDPLQLESMFPDMVVKYASGQVLNQFGVNYEAYQKQGNGYVYTLQPLKSIYLDSNLEGEMKPPGSRDRIYFFSMIALLIIAIAGMNFMNLATARSASRAREVGIRKTLGSMKGQLIFQFLTEAVLIALIASILAGALTLLVLPAFNELTEKHFVWEQIISPAYLGILLALALLTGLTSGLYPAFFMSSFKPIQVLRGKLMKNTKGLGLRNVLVVFQFAISVFLIATTLMIFKQMDYTQSKLLGFDKESLVTLQNAGGMTQQQSETFLDQLTALPGVVAASGCNTTPGSYYVGMSFGPANSSEMTTGSGMIVGEGYVECMKMEMAEGREFSDRFMDTLSVVINEAAVREMGLEEPIGARLKTNDNLLNPNPDEQSVYTVVGVVKDYHFQSLHHTISPLFLVHRQRNFIAGVSNLISVRMAAGNAQNTLSQIEQLWKQVQPEIPFSYAFMDREWANLYSKEMTSRKVFSLFTLLAIFIACMGLLALASFATEQRIKEIGIRKVLGASLTGLITLLSRDFIKLVLIAILIATPLAWYFVGQWLEQFAYRIDMQWWVFALSGILACLIAWVTVAVTSMRAALTSPVKNLRND